jgi:hypothetical protein
VQRVALTTADLEGGMAVSLAKGGSVVKGQTTLGPCGYAYTSEAHRVARREVVVVTAARQPTGIFNEAVVYDSPASAAKSLSELRTALAHCPRTFVHESGGSSPLVQFSRVRTQVLTGAMVKVPGETFDEGVVATFTETAKSPHVSVYAIVIGVRKGSVVTYVGMGSRSPLTAAQAQATGALSDVTVRRLPAA